MSDHTEQTDPVSRPAVGGPVEHTVRPLMARLDVLRVLLAERYPEHHATVADAQAEIERLRDALQGMLDAMPSSHLWDDPPPRLSDLADGLLKAKAVARDALRWPN